MSEINIVQAGQSAKPLVFVVDDEPMLLDLGRAVLEPAGFEIRTFRNPESLLKVYATTGQWPALIITDYAMHKMTGMDLVRECRQIHPGQKIILLSGTVDEAIYSDSYPKPDRFMAKPYQAGQLIALVNEVLTN